MERTLKELKDFCLSEYGCKVEDALIKSLTKTTRISHKKTVCKDDTPVIEFCRKWKDCEDKGYKRIKDLQKEIKEKYNIEVPVQSLYKQKPKLVKLSRKLIYVADWQRLLDYFSVPISERRKNTMVQTYGVENPMQNNGIALKSRKRHENNDTLNTLGKFFHKDPSTIKNIISILGIEPVSKGKQKFYDKSTRELIAKFLSLHTDTKNFFYSNTCTQKYGKTNVSALEEIKEKKKQTSLKHYGVDNYSKSDKGKKELSAIGKRTAEHRASIRKETTERLIALFEEQNDCISLTHLNRQYSLGYDKAGRFSEIIHKLSLTYLTYQSNLFVYRKDIDKILNYKESCTEKQTSFFEREIKEYISLIYQGEVLSNNRNVIPPKELDLYIPEKRVAIEFDGLYWHSELFVEKNYHLGKTLECEKQGIRLLHIFEDEWIFKKDICKSLIASALGIYKQKIYARKCTVRFIDKNLAKDFLEQNHIQGYVRSASNFGLFYNGVLVQVISLGKSRFKQNETELLRMATLQNTQVIGGFSKLLSYAMNSMSIDELYSYVDRRLFNGNGYKSSGFEKVGESQPSYFYFKGLHRKNRLAYQKHKLKETLKVYDDSLTEKENMLGNHYHIIYDCGTLKMRYGN